MSKRTKNLILFASFGLFFVLGSLLLSYAHGYKFDFEELKWVKTGGLAVKANVDGAQIFIDNQRTGKIPFLSNIFTQKNLLPGQYSLRIEDDGSPPILKNVEVVSGQVTQLIHVYLPKKEEIDDFIAATAELEEKPIPYFISSRDRLLYKKIDSETTERISAEPVYIKNFSLKNFKDSFYLVSNDFEAPGLFSLNSEGKWDRLFARSLTDAALSDDGKKLAIIGENEIRVLWLENDNEAPYFRQGHTELVLHLGQKIEKVLWFKTDWHLIYLTSNGETRFIEVDPTGGRNDILI